MVRAEWDQGELVTGLGPITLIALSGLLIVGSWLILGPHLRRRWGATAFNLSLFGLIDCTIARNSGTAQVAHEAYVELATRKAALPFDPQRDVISEIYDSWRDLFSELRRIARQVRADEVRTNPALEDLLDLIFTVLNEGLRPHLTTWQAPFRHWFEAAQSSGAKSQPAELQRQFPGYTELYEDLQRTNELLREFSSSLRRLAYE